MRKIEILKKMVADNPENGELWYLIGLEHIEMNQKNEAILALSEAIKFSEDTLRDQIAEQLVRTTKMETKKDTGIDLVEKCTVEKTEKSNVIPFQVINGNRNKYSTQLKSINFLEVGGLEDVKKAIHMKIIQPFLNPAMFKKFKKKVGGGVILYGPPGCGKTFLARATAGECQASFKSISITDILSKYIGESEQNIKNIFDEARSNKPCVLFFDELDSIGFHRGKMTSEYLRLNVNQLLSEIDGVDTDNDKLLFIGATNMPWDIDPGLKRPGRFDKLLFIPPPDVKAREAIFKLKMVDRLSGNIDYTELAKRTELYSGADIENIVEVASEKVISDILVTGIERSIEQCDLMEAIDNTRPTTIEWLKTAKNYVKFANQSGIYDDVEKFLKNHRNI